MPPLCRETRSLGQQMLNATAGKKWVKEKKNRKNNSDQSPSCPRDWRLPGVPNWGLKLLRPSQHSIVSRGLRGASIGPPMMPRDTSVSYRGCNFLQFGGPQTILHSEKSFRNFVESYQNQIVFINFRLFWYQTGVHLVPNQLENGKYNLISVRFDMISKRFLCVRFVNHSSETSEEILFKNNV